MTKSVLERELVRFDQEIISLEEILDTHIKVLNRMVEGVRNETLGDTETAAKNRAVSDALVEKARKVSQALAAAVTAQTNLDKTAEKRKKKMDQGAMAQLMIRAILSMPYEKRKPYLLDLIKAHNERSEVAMQNGLVNMDGLDAMARTFAEVW
jgi:hypothetical protein